MDEQLIERPEPPREPGWYLCTYGPPPEPDALADVPARRAAARPTAPV